jgi:transposase
MRHHHVDADRRHGVTEQTVYRWKAKYADDVSRACPAIEVGISLPGARVLRVLDR